MGELGEQRFTGHVKWFNDAKGFSFIVPDGGGQECFVHYSDIDGDGFRSLDENDRVEFEIERGEKGLKATSVRLISKNFEPDEEGGGATTRILRLTTIQVKSIASRAAELVREHEEMTPTAAADQAIHEQSIS